MALSVEVAIVGGGAAGMMAAVALKGCDYRLFETGGRCGRKLLASGGGFANLTHEQLDLGRFDADRAFIAPALAAFDNRAVMDFFTQRGVKLQTRDQGEVFTQEGAKVAHRVLQKEIPPDRIESNCRIDRIETKEGGFMLHSTRGVFRARQVILATGSNAWPSLQSSADGLVLAGALGHTAVPFTPVLAGLTLQPPQFWMKALSGIALPVQIEVGTHRCMGNLLFAHRGISGPAVLNASLWWQKGSLVINFLPHTPIDSVLNYTGKKTLVSLLPLPGRLLKALLTDLQLPPLPPSRLSTAQKETLKQVWHYKMAPAGSFGLSKAEACRGGLKSCEFDPHTLQSRVVPGLYAVGEVLNVTGEVGGFNLQWAFSSAVAAAKAVKKLSPV